MGKGIAMQEQARIEGADYKVLVNHEEQYSLCPLGPAERANPPGWRDAGFSGSREACLAYINETWIDMRPASLRQRLAEAAAAPASAPSAPPARKPAKARR